MLWHLLIICAACDLRLNWEAEKVRMCLLKSLNKTSDFSEGFYILPNMSEF